jgi:hypothetical protein
MRTIDNYNLVMFTVNNRKVIFCINDGVNATLISRIMVGRIMIHGYWDKMDFDELKYRDRLYLILNF